MQNDAADPDIRSIFSPYLAQFRPKIVSGSGPPAHSILLRVS